MSAVPATIGATSFGMSWPEYWLSASVLTMTSAPSLSAASRPAWKPAARPLLLVRRTMWSTPLARATSMVRSVEPSSMTSHSTVSKPSTWRGRSASVAGSVASSLRQGIWMMSFMRGRAGATGRAERSTPYTRWRPVSHMESATITRPAPGPDPATGRPRRRWSWPMLLLAALALGTLVGFIVYPTYPNYDSYYSLLWGRELLHGVKPSFDGYRTPTEHPLAVAFGALLSIVGDPADRIMVGATLGTFVGLAAAGLLCTRFDFPFLAARAYIDIPYLAFVVWAAALESERPRRGTPVFLLLACAGLMRPEAWLLGGLYFLWCFAPADWPGRVRYAVLTGFPPVLWTALDWWATGDPKFSLTHTNGLAEELGRTAGLADIPSSTVRFLKSLD